MRNEAEAIALANASPFALSSSIWTGNQARGRRIAAQLSAGSCSVNDVIRTIANPYAAFGGNRLSGYGRYHGPEGLRSFSRVRTIMLASDRRTREINWFPFNSRTRRQLASLSDSDTEQPGSWARLRRLLLPLLVSTILPAAPSLRNPRSRRISPLTSISRSRPMASLPISSSPHASGFPGDRDKAIRHGFLPIPSNGRSTSALIPISRREHMPSAFMRISTATTSLITILSAFRREPVGVSNNPIARFGPPHFDECSFQLGDTAQTITITLVHGS